MAESRDGYSLSSILSRFPLQFSKEGCFFIHNGYTYEVTSLIQENNVTSSCTICLPLCEKLETRKTCWSVRATRIWPVTIDIPPELVFGICTSFSQLQTSVTDDSIKTYQQFIRKEQRGNRWTNIEVNIKPEK